MELWWWIEPLWYTAMLCFRVDIIIGCLVVQFESDSKVLFAILITLLVPTVVAFLSTAVWGICFMLCYIWKPYF